MGGDGVTGGEPQRLGKLLKESRGDLIYCSSGGNLPDAPVPKDPGYQVFIADEVRKAAGIPTAAVGLITQPRMADEIIRSGKADVVLVGREMLRTPYWPLLAARELGLKGPVPPQFLRAFKRKGFLYLFEPNGVNYSVGFTIRYATAPSTGMAARINTQMALVVEDKFVARSRTRHIPSSTIQAITIARLIN